MRTTDEWLQAFNQYYNNLSSNKAPGIEPVEISRHLTDAEYSIVIGLYTGTLGVSFEATEQATAYLASLVSQSEIEPIAKVGLEGKILHPFFDDDKSYLFPLPADLLFRTLEYCTLTSTPCGEKKNVAVVPVTQDELLRTFNNPFKGPNQRKVLRLSYAETAPVSTVSGSNKINEQGYSELVSNYPVTSYTVRYLKKPLPIIIGDLPDGLSIDGYDKDMTCALPEALHQLILTEAVRLAKAVWQA